MRRLTFYGRTRKEAQEKLNKALASLADGTFVRPNKVTVGQWLVTWLQEYIKPAVRSSTYESYETLVRCHVIPILGRLPLKDLRPEHLQKLYNDLLDHGRCDGKGGLSPRSVRYLHSILHHALTQVLENGLVVRNVADAARPPREEKKEIRPLTPEQIVSLLSAAKGDRLYAALVLEFHTGLRLGELLALTWNDIDFRAGVVRVRRTLARVKDEECPGSKRAIMFQEPKTEKGFRDIPIPDEVISVLKSHRIRQAEERLMLGPGYKDMDLVFPTQNGTPIHPRNFLRYWDSVLKKAGLPKVRFHDARHTFATLLLELGEHPKTVQEILGHSTIRVTLDTYSHVRPDLVKSAVEKVAKLLEEARS